MLIYNELLNRPVHPAEAGGVVYRGAGVFLSTEMTQLREWILEAAEGEPLEGVVIGSASRHDAVLEMSVEVAPDCPTDRVLSWDEAQPFLRYEFEQDFGSVPCHPVTVWTPSWVIALSVYDGWVDWFRLPRNPRDHTPGMPGGGG